MSRPFTRLICLFALPLICGCREPTDHSDAVSLFYPNSVQTVNLPYDAALNKALLRVSIRTIPARPDAVRVEAQVQRKDDVQRFEWIQAASSEKTIVTDDARDQYIIQLRELHLNGRDVSGVTLSIWYRILR